VDRRQAKLVRKSMRPHRLLPGNSRGELWAIAAAIPLGISFALFISGYWLIDLVPIQSRQIWLLAALAALAAAAGYFILVRWLWRRWVQLDRLGRFALVMLGLLVAGFAFFGGTKQWLEPRRYISLLLPSHELRISASQSAGPRAVALTWFNTSLGDVSFATLESQGWLRQGDQMVLADASNNALAWRGLTGEQIQMVFDTTAAGSTLDVTWDGQDDTLILPRGKTTYDHAFPVPDYASRGLILGLGLLNFLLLAMGLLLLLGEQRSSWQTAMEKSVGGGRGRLDRRDLAAILAALALAMLLRVFNLGATFPAVDEYYHLIAAQQLLHGAALGSVYPRGLFLVTIPISLGLRSFGHQIWAARLAGVLFNVLAVVPLYLVARKINRPIASVACVLYGVSPWIITFARVAREYAVYPFYFYWIVYAMVLLVEAIPQGFVLAHDWKAILRPRAIVLLALLCVPPWFGLTIDWLSTFRTILIAYVILGVVVLARFDWADRLNWPVLGVAMLGVAFSARAWYQEQASKLLPWPRINSVPLQYFLPNPQQQWYFDRLVLVMALAVLCGAGYCYVLRRKNFVAPFMYLLFGAYLAIFALLSKTFFHTRHLMTTEVWYVVVTAIGLYALWTIVLAVVPLRRTGLRVGLAVAIGLAITNGSQILLPSISTNPDMPISEDYLHDMSKIQEFMLEHARPNDVLISTVYGLYAFWEEEPQFQAQYRITSATPKEDIFELVDNNASGWIVVDKIRLDLSRNSLRDFSGEDRIEYIGTFGDEYVWRWQRLSGWAPAAPGLERRQ